MCMKRMSQKRKKSCHRLLDVASDFWFLGIFTHHSEAATAEKTSADGEEETCDTNVKEWYEIHSGPKR